uniref:Cadherin domain-containing protein n=1 Tax=Romanomermis culicivorax TaxID=13658 RepID=A0A915JC69_ROMCU
MRQNVYAAHSPFFNSKASDSFTIDSKTGRVKTARTNYEPSRTYLVYVQAHDRTWQNSTSRVSDVAKLDIKVGQRPPQFFQESYKASVVEDLPVAASVAQVKAMSFINNPDNPIRFSLFEENPNNNFENNHAIAKNTRSQAFSMNEETGVVHLAKNLDFDDPRESKSYKLTVVANEGGLKSTVPLEITVRDVNDNDPYFTQPLYTATINEDHPIGQKILRIVAKDKDGGRNADITYHLDNGNFTVDKRGYVSPKVRLDADQKQLGVFIYRFLATATDNGDPPRSATSQVQIKTLNVNDEAPFFVPTSLYTDYVAEDAQGNTPILYVQAQDPDRDQVKYAFLNERNEQVASIRHFEIDRDTGLIKLREGIEPIHLREQDSYEMKVIAIDDSTCCLPKKNIVHSSVAKVKIGVKDINNNKPVFHDCDKYSKIARVPEGKHQHLLIIRVEATDNDSGQNGDIVYSLYYPGGDNRRPFTINATTGEIWASPFVEFDREERAFEDVTVKATDKGSRPLIGFCHFTVTVDDENDNSPEFNRAAYEGSVSRSTPIGQSIVTVFADDRDGPNNSQITYSLKADPNEPDHEQDATYFRINDKGGEIVLTNVVPAQRQKMVFLVVATDNGQNPRNSQAKVTIDVAEAAKHYPVWLSHPKCPSEVTVDEDVQINHVFFECYSISGTAESNPISYSMRNGQKPNANSNGDFREFQTKKNGKDYVIIRNLKPLDHEKINKYELTISAKVGV